MKLAVLADIHGNKQALEAVLEDLEKQEAAAVAVLGDIVMIGPQPREVLQILKNLQPLAIIKGNTDMWLEQIDLDFVPQNHQEDVLFRYFEYCAARLTEEDKQYLRALPEQQRLVIAGWEILCVHGSPRDVIEGIGEQTPRQELEAMLEGVSEKIITCGHTHIPFEGKVKGKLVINAGSVGRPLNADPRASYCLLDFSFAEPKVIFRLVPYPVEQVLEIARQSSLPYLKRYSHNLRYGVLPGEK